jgi:photosystem II stability/assembly factor-like uncharacterized protein
MQTRSLAPTAVAAALMTLLVIVAAIVTRGDAAEPVRAVVPAAAPEPDAEDWMYLQRANADGSIPDAAVNEAIAQSKAAGQASMGSPATDQVWTVLGPSNIGGRIRDVAADPTTQNEVYVATGSGGVWRSTDAGATLQLVWDHYLPQSIGAIAVDSKGVVWAGTGEVDHGGGSAYYGNGIYKSTDDGATWTKMGLEDGDTIGQIVIDPRNDNRIFVAVMGALHDLDDPDRGLFMTENGGASWTRVITPESTNTGGIDVTINKSNPDIMLATTWDKTRDEKSRIYGPHSYLYRSTDGGRTWTKNHNPPLPQSPTDPALQNPDTLVGRMGVDFSDSNPNRAYLISSTARGNFNGLFVSNDAGATWTEVTQTSTTLQAISGGFAWWFGRVYVDPVNPDHIIVAGVNYAESVNGGLTWTTRSTNVIHADQHGLEFDPLTPGRVYLGNDGGFYISNQNGSAAGVWFKTPRLPVTQFYAMDVSVQDGTRVSAGSQDNNSLKSWQNDNTVTGDWMAYVGGDGMMNRIDPTNDRKFYGCSQNGGCRRFFPGSNNGVAMTIPGLRKNWVAPLEFAADPRFLFGASENVYRIDTEPANTTPRPWIQISGDLTDGPDLPRAPGFGTITALGTTTADPNLVYAGTDSGRMWVSRNAMAPAAEVTWTELHSTLFPGRWVTRITVDPDNAQIAWATFSGWRNYDSFPHILMTSDGGNTWVDIAGKKLPQAPVNDVIRHWSKPKWLFIATDVGVWRTTNLGKTWLKVGDNLPLVPVNDIDLPAGSNTLYAATYGRSVWTTSIEDAS